MEIPVNSLKEQYPIEGVYTFSIKKDKKKLKDFRGKVADYIKSNPSWENQVIPASYYQVKDELEAIFVRGEKKTGREYITKKEFNEIAAKHEVEDIKELLTGLHALGVSLWYEEMEDRKSTRLNSSH